MPSITFTTNTAVGQRLADALAAKYNVPATAAGIKEATIRIWQAEVREAERAALLAVATETALQNVEVS